MIRDAYERAAKIIAASGNVPEIESFAVAQKVEQLRLAWRPPYVRVVLLAESHVWTSERECVESDFVRFVYCLGYGERTLALGVSPNSGTWQYWRLFHDAVHGPNSPPIIRRRNPTERISAKLRLLNELKLAGIWLVDASVTALYKPGGGRLLSSKSDYKKVLRACWEAHVGDAIADCRASAVLIVGKGVDAAIGDLVRQALHKAEVAVVSQPNARTTSEKTKQERFEERLKVFDLCRRYGSN